MHILNKNKTKNTHTYIYINICITYTRTIVPAAEHGVEEGDDGEARDDEDEVEEDEVAPVPRCVLGWSGCHVRVCGFTYICMHM